MHTIQIKISVFYFLILDNNKVSLIKILFIRALNFLDLKLILCSKFEYLFFFCNIFSHCFF